MKKFTKIMLILAGVCIILGMSLIIGAGMFGDMYGHNADIHIGLDGVKINGIELDDISAGMVKDLKQKKDGNAVSDADTDADRLVLADADVCEVEIAVNAADLEIIRSEDTDVISLEDVSEYLEFKYSVEGKALHLTIQRKDKYKTLGIAGEAYATLVIPANVRFEEFDIKANASALDAKSIVSERLELEVNASSVDISDINVGDLDVNNNAGEMTIDGNVERKLDVECNAGDVEVQLTGIYQDFNYSLQTNAGSIQVGDQEYSGLKKEKNIKNAVAKKVAELECNMGSIEIDFFD